MQLQLALPELIVFAGSVVDFSVAFDFGFVCSCVGATLDG
jgi:hypothetical protein